MDWLANFLPSLVVNQGSFNQTAAAVTILSLLNAQSPTDSPSVTEIPPCMITTAVGTDVSRASTLDQNLAEKIWTLLPGCARLPRSTLHPMARQLRIVDLKPSSYNRPVYVFSSEQDLKHSNFFYVHANGIHVTSFQLLENQIGGGKHLSISARAPKHGKGTRDMAKLLKTFCHSFRLPDDNCINEEAFILTMALTQYMLQVDNENDRTNSVTKFPFGIRRIMRVNAVKNWNEYVTRHGETGTILVGMWCDPPRMLTLLDDHLKNQGYFQCYVYDRVDDKQMRQYAYLFFVDFRDDEFLQAFNHRTFSFDDVAAAAVFCFTQIESFLSKKYASTFIKVRKPRRDEFLRQTEIVTGVSGNVHVFETRTERKSGPEILIEGSRDQTKARASRRQGKSKKKKAKHKASKQTLQVGNEVNYEHANTRPLGTNGDLVEQTACTASAGTHLPPVTSTRVKQDAHHTSSASVNSHLRTSNLSNQISGPQMPREGSAALDITELARFGKANPGNVKTSTNSWNVAEPASPPWLLDLTSQRKKTPLASSDQYQHPRFAAEKRTQGNVKHSRKEKQIYPSHLLFSYASENRINSYWLPRCQKRTSPFESATTICPRCGINSYVRYCTVDHLLQDILRHYQYDCGRRPNVLRIDKSTQPESQLPARPFIAADIQAGAINTPERHRQAVCRSIYTKTPADYFIFGDLDVLWSQHGYDYIPTKEDIQQIRCTGRAVAEVNLTDPIEKRNLDSMLKTVLAKGAAAGRKWSQGDARMQQQGLNDPLNVLYLWLKQGLARQSRWDERMCDRLCLQMQFEYGHTVDESLR